MNTSLPLARLLAYCVVLVLALITFSSAYAGIPYYISQSGGSDGYDGTSATYSAPNHGPWKTLTKASTKIFSAGDQLLLRSGDTWVGEVLNLKGNGTSSNPILLSSYGSGVKPKIAPALMDTACVKIAQYSGWKITNLELYDAMNGVLMEYDNDYDNDYMWIENCFIHDMGDKYNSQPLLYNHYSSGIEANGRQLFGLGSSTKIVLSNLTIKGVTFNKCNTATWLMGSIFKYVDPQTGFGGRTGRLKNLTMLNCVTTNGAQWGYNVLFCKGGTVTNCDTDNIGFGPNPSGNAGIVVAYSDNVTFDSLTLTNTHRGPNPADGMSFDFEGGIAEDGTNQHDIILKNSTIDGADACGIYLFDNAGKTTQNFLIDNVTVSNFSLNPPTENESGLGAIRLSFKSGEAPATGTVQNSTFNRSNLSVPFLSSNKTSLLPQNVTFLNMTYTDLPLPGVGQNELINPTFETALTAPGISFQGPYTYNRWKFGTNTGLQRNASGAPTAPEGIETAYIISTGSFLQTVNFTSSVPYQIKLKTARKSTDVNHTFDVYVDATRVGSFTTAQSTFVNLSTNSFTPAVGSHVIKFIGTTTVNTTSFVDELELVPVGSPTTKKWDFETASGGAQEWTPVTGANGSGSWSLTTDGSQVYQQTNTVGSFRSVAGNLSWTNYSLQAKIKLVSGNVVRLIARYQDEANFYYLETSTSQLTLRRVKAGQNTIIGSPVNVSLPAGNWFTLKLELNGNSFQAYLNTQLKLGPISDIGGLSNGKVGLNTFNAEGHFDDVTVTDLDGGGLRKPAEEPTLETQLTAYPNPVREQLQVRYYTQQMGEVRCELLNARAQVIKQVSQQVKPGEVNLSISVTTLTTGIYVLRVSEGNRQVSKKVLIAQ